MGKMKAPEPLALDDVEIVCHYDMCAIRPEKIGEFTAGGIVLPEIARQQRTPLVIGTIVSRGPGRYAEQTGVRLEMPYQVGDRVVYQQTQYGGGELEVNGEKLDLVGSPSIYCSLMPKKAKK